MDRDIANILGGAVLCVGAAGLYAYTLGAGYDMGEGVAYDAGLLPRLWLAIAAICAAGLVLKGTLGRMRRPGAAEPLATISPPRLLASLGLVTVFLAAFAWLGFWLPVLLFIPAFSLVFGYRNIPVILAATAIFATATWLVFVNLLEVQMDAFPQFLMMGG